MAKPAILTNKSLNQKTYNKEFLDEALNETIGLPEYDSDARQIIFTRKDGARFAVTLPVIDMPFELEIDEASKEVVFNLKDGTVRKVPMSELLISYEGATGEQIQVTVDSAKAEISAELLNGSISEEKLHSSLAAKLGDQWEVEQIP
jgi:hypothetical protein